MRLNLLYGGSFISALLAPLFAYRGLSMNVSIPIPATAYNEAGQVANLQLLFEQQACIAIAVGLAIVAAVLFGCGAIIQSLDRDAEPDSVSYQDPASSGGGPGQH